ncbi:MAG: SUMF1/EgtB/PvdO family nonheme iron enzyme [Gammaproteobacteria bacterium]|nr:SUMF1/EgtB/PvdO family nonheme iron enzyme [Gammaproteobacteria bacterium]MBU1723639.1 SUMF1/EgtB/PvdO family nonheme iron enzyme [Gammaproteobacteria bacterium]MBU2005635.1 SUMF1/EgtB/PvdO family nonheme iron enzyme [Gammaproteobacteria bacterium]
MAQRSDALPEGYELDRYRIDRVLGDGGFGITYLGEHAAGWQVAIKELFPSEYAFREGGKTGFGGTNIIARGGSYAENFQAMKESFLREARILAQFAEHPNIVTVKDFFEANGTAYLVMQYEEGQTIEEWLAKTPHPTQEQLLQIFIPVLDGLRAVHAANYLHRDIKPGNIYIRSDGRPFLLDFGAAREVIASKKSMVLTDGYSPFEQYSTNGNQGAWTDIYATGATLWSCLNGGTIPASAMNRANARVDGNPDPYEPASLVAKGRYADEFLAAIDWALAFPVKDRPQTVREWQDSLLGLLQDSLKSPEPKAASTPREPTVAIPEAIHEPVIKPQDNRPTDALPQGHKLASYIIGRFMKASSFGYLYEASFFGTTFGVPKEYRILEITPKYAWEHEFYQQRATLFLNAQHQRWEKVWDYIKKGDKQYIVLDRDEQFSIAGWQSLNQVTSEKFLFDNVVTPLLYGIRKINQKEKIPLILDEDDLFFTATEDGFSNIKIRLTAGLKIRGYDNRGVTLMPAGDFAPESFDKKNRGAWTTIYFIGTVLHFLVTGRWPENYSNRVASLLNQGTDPYIPLTRLAANRYNKAFLEAIDWSLKTNHRERPQTLDDFHDALRGKNQKATPQPAPKPQPTQHAAPQRPITRIIRLVEPKMVYIPAGKFIMGCVGGRKNWFGIETGNRDDVDGCYDYEKPAHEVNLSAFAICKYPVTFDEFDCFCEATDFPKPHDAGWGRGNRPVINVSWPDAQAYSNWLAEMTGKAYRLPTEAEWEYAARAGSTTAYPWGMVADPQFANYGNKVGKTTPVDQYPANKFGLHDMHGNVWEWVQDWYGSYEIGPLANPKGARSGAFRVLRGGSWSNEPWRIRSANRHYSASSSWINIVGFRLAQS